VFGDFVPRDVNIDVLHGGIAEYRFQYCRVSLDGMNDPPHTTVRPDDRNVWMTLAEVSHLGELDGLGAFLRERHVRHRYGSERPDQPPLQNPEVDPAPDS